MPPGSPHCATTLCATLCRHAPPCATMLPKAGGGRAPSQGHTDRRPPSFSLSLVGCVPRRERDGDEYVCIADFLTESRRKALALARGDDKSFASVSRGQRLNAKGEGPVALAARVGKEIVIDSAMMDGVMKRATLAKEYGIKRLHLVPTNEGVFEYGTPADAFLSGPLMEASLKMRCDTSGAGCERRRKLAHAGAHRRECLHGGSCFVHAAVA